MDDYVITTIFFDGQFWIALIEKCCNGKFFSGKFIFGSEPSNPELLDWMKYQYLQVKLFPVENPVKIKIKKQVNHSHSLKNLLIFIKKARKLFSLKERLFKKRKNERCKKWTT